MNEKNEIDKLISSTSKRFLTTNELNKLFVLANRVKETDLLTIQESCPIKPSIPSFFFIQYQNTYNDINEQDGHWYEKRNGNDNRGIKICKQVLRSKKSNFSIDVYYSNGKNELNEEAFQRRVYIHSIYQDFKLVHYLHKKRQKEKLCVLFAKHGVPQMLSL